MIKGRRSTDWSQGPKANGPDERRSDERRAKDRRAPRRPYDPMFMATLINQVAPIEIAKPAGAYAAPNAANGRRLNLFA